MLNLINIVWLSNNWGKEMKMAQGKLNIFFKLGLLGLVLVMGAVVGPNMLWAKSPVASPIHDFLVACYSGTIEEVKKGIEAGADVNGASAQGTTPLKAAILGRTDSMEKVKILLTAKADPNLAGEYLNNTALDYALNDSEYNLNLIKLILEADFKVNPTDSKSRVPLQNVCMASSRWADKERALLLKEFIKRGADVNYKNDRGLTPLIICATSSGPQSLKVLLEAGAQVNVASDIGRTPLMGAASYNSHPESIILLLDHRANPDQGDNNKKTPVEMSKTNSTPGGPYIQAILNNPKKRKQWKLSEPPTADDLILLSYVGTAEEVKRAIEAGAEVNYASKQGYTSLSAAVASKVDSLEKVALLLKAKANPNLTNKRDETPLLLAITNNNNLEIVRLLLEAKADINAVDYTGITPFMQASWMAYSSNNPDGWVEDKHAKLLKLLIENGADIYSRRYGDGERVGNSALLMAAGKSGPESLRVLLEAGMAVNGIASPHGLSSLLMAAESNVHPESISLLLEYGADPNYVCMKKGCDALTLTESYYNSWYLAPERMTTERIKEILREAIKKSKK